MVIVYFYEAEVKQLLVGEINKQLLTPIKVKNIDLSLIKKFPNASLVFSEVSANSVQPTDSSHQFKENLFEAKRIYLQFNLLDIFHKKYHINQIDIEDSKLNLLVTKEGIDNFHFWKKSSDSAASPFQLKLEQIKVQNAEVIYQNDAIAQLYSIIIKESELIGNFSESSYSLQTQGQYYVDELRIDKTIYLKRKSISMSGNLEVTANEKYAFQDIDIKVNDLQFGISGNVIIPEKSNTALDLKIIGKNLDIETLISLLPDEFRKKLNTYSSSGLFYFDAKIKGETSAHSSPLFTANFGIQNGEIEEGISDLNLENIALSGSYSNGKSRNAAGSQLNIKNFSAQLGAGKVVGNFSIVNFNNPYLKVVADAALNLSQVKQFLKLDTLEKCSGQLRIDIDFSGNTKHIRQFSGEDFAKTTTQGSLTLEQGNIKFVGAKHSFESLNASLLFNNNDIVVNECNGKIMDSDFALKGFFRNALAAAFNNDEKLFIEASLSSKMVNLDQLLASNESSVNSDDEAALKFSKRINFNLNVEIRNLVFKRFEASNIKGAVKLLDQKMALSPVTFNTMDGTVMANGFIDGTSDDGFKTLCDADLRNINISKLFYEFENFGGSTLTDKNLKGKASSTVQFAGNFSPSLKPNTESIVSRFDLSIENGELLNFEPLRKLSRFISLSELNNIRFASLKNSIEVKKRSIAIPKMEIQNSALNLSMAGTHSFDNVVDYHFKLLLNELLAKKARKAKPENEEFGSIEEDGLGLGKTAIYISMIGPLENPKISYDKSGFKLQMKQNVSSEKQNLKSILKNEFGWFKNDSTVKSSSTKKQQTKFETEWEESNPTAGSKSGNEKQLPKVKATEPAPEIKVKALDKLLKKGDEAPTKKKKEKPQKEENSDDFN